MVKLVGWGWFPDRFKASPGVGKAVPEDHPETHG